MKSLKSSTVSPWTLGIQNVGVRGLGLVVNGAVLTSAFSCGNAFSFLEPGHFILPLWQDMSQDSSLNV